MQPTVARTLVCLTCGGRIPFSGPQASVACPYCHSLQQISEAQHHELAEYQTSVHRELERAEQERSHVRQWDRWYGGRGGRAKAGLGVPMAVFGSALVLSIVLAGASQSLMMSGAPLAQLAMQLTMFGVPILFLAAYIGYVIWYYGGKRRELRATAPLGSFATCPNCGAENTLAPGQVVECCAFCCASLMPSKAIMDQAFNGAEAARLRAELERYRTERRGMATAIRSSAAAFIPYVMLGSFLLMTLSAAIGFTVDALRSGKFEPGLLGVWGVAAVNSGLIGIVYVWRRTWSERFGRIAKLASAKFVQRGLDFDAFIGWLNAHWAGPVPLTEIFAGAHFHAVALIIEEYPGLLVLNPKPLADGYPGYLAIYLAARIPAVHANRYLDPATTAPQRASLEALGFRVSLESGGLKAHADARVALRLAKRPDGGKVLAQVAMTLLGMARATSAMAVQLPPE